MPDIFHRVLQAFTEDKARAIAQCLGIWLVSLLLLRLMRRRISARSLHPQHRLLIVRVTTLVIYAVAITSSLQVLGVQLGVLLGAAGVLTVALGFAAQTSTSNLISGLFLIFEQPFRVGDSVRVGDVTGEVVSIGLVSVRLKTPENLLVRIPNETMLKSNVINQTHYPIRRLDLKIALDLRSDVEQARKALMTVADRHPLCLDEPLPRVMHLGYGTAAIDLVLSVWVLTENVGELRDQLHEAIRREFDAQAIEIPYPHTSLTVAGDALPLRIVGAPLSPSSSVTPAPATTEAESSEP